MGIRWYPLKVRVEHPTTLQAAAGLLVLAVSSVAVAIQERAVLLKPAERFKVEVPLLPAEQGRVARRG